MGASRRVSVAFSAVLLFKELPNIRLFRHTQPARAQRVPYQTDSHSPRGSSLPTPTPTPAARASACSSPRTAAGHKNDDNFVLFFYDKLAVSAPHRCVRGAGGGVVDLPVVGVVWRLQICLLLVTFLNNFYCCKSQCQL